MSELYPIFCKSTLKKRLGKLILVVVLVCGMSAAPMMAYADNEPASGEQTGTGKTTLKMILRDAGEKGGIDEPAVVEAPDGTDPDDLVDANGNPDPNGSYIKNPLYNPDSDNNGLGDNIAFTVPTSIDYVVNPDGSLIGPSNAYIENDSAFGIGVSSLAVNAFNNWHFVADASQSGAQNSVDLQMGPTADMLQLSDYVDNKRDVVDERAWCMGTADEAAEYMTVFDVSDAFYTGVLTENDFDLSEGDLYWYHDGKYIPFSAIERSDDGVVADSGQLPAYVPLVENWANCDWSYSFHKVFEYDSQEYSVVYRVGGGATGHFVYASNGDYGVSTPLCYDESIFVKMKPGTTIGLSKKLSLSTSGDVSHVTADISSMQSFGEIRWYVSPKIDSLFTFYHLGGKTPASGTA